MIRTVGLAVFGALVMVSCASEETGSEERAKTHAEQRLELSMRIDSLETIMEEKNLLPGDELMGELLKDYIEYTEKFPGDMDKTPEYLYKAAAISRAVNLPVKAIKLYDRILAKYPRWEKAPEVAFLTAFTYDEDLGEPELAKESYEKVIEKYPGDLWAVQAEQRLATVGMSDDELLEFLKEKQKEAEAAED
ncbi:tetratricopeptide repeat protein [Cryomorphaceae bacterium 1068]|nr:tetratricopeptide repeat protein [Cryomorphaceae bacterium 1068]